MTRDVVYTVLIEGYDPIRPQPIAGSSDADFICFTDNVDVDAAGWRLVEVEPMLEGDPVRSQRMLKILGHEALREYDRILYIDNTVELRRDPAEILDVLLDGTDLGMFEHSFRERLIDEFDEVVRLNYDDAPRVHEQLWAYSQWAPDVLERKPLWTAVIARRQTPQLAEFAEVWSREVLRYSRRDQLSVLYALERAGVAVTSPAVDNFDSEWHVWSTSPERRVAQGKSSLMPAGPLVAEARRSESIAEAARVEAEEARQQVPELEARLAASEAELAALREQLERCEERTGLIRKEMGSARKEREALREVVREMSSSTSWRVTAPLRSVGALKRRLRGTE